MQAPQVTSASQPDEFKWRKNTTSENLRMQIVEMAVKNSDFDEQRRGNFKRSQAVTVKDIRNPSAKRNDTTLGYHDDRKKSIVYPMVQRKKDFINLNFTTAKRDSKEERKVWGNPNPKEINTREKERPITSILHLRKNKVCPVNDRTETTRGEGENKSQRIKCVDQAMPSSASPRKDQPVNVKSAHTTRAACPSSLDNNNNDKHNNKRSEGHNEERIEPNNRLNDMKTKGSNSRTREVIDKCEVKGNAIPTTPQHHTSIYLWSPKKSGVFSASLAAFKRRLKISSKKFTARLHDESSAKEEEYIISVDKANMRAYNDDIARRPNPFKAKRINVEVPSTNQTLSGTKTPKTEDNNIEVTRQGHIDQASSPESTESSPSNVLPAAADNALLANAQGKLPQVTNAKTYVLETDQPLMVKSKHPEPIPLTSHNLRLHESLLSMQARRARRLERSRRTFKNTTNNGSNKTEEDNMSADYAILNERIQRWLHQVDDAVEEEETTDALEETPRNIFLQPEYRIPQPCASEYPFDIHQAHKTVIFV